MKSLNVRSFLILSFLVVSGLAFATDLGASSSVNVAHLGRAYSAARAHQETELADKYRRLADRSENIFQQIGYNIRRRAANRRARRWRQQERAFADSAAANTARRGHLCGSACSPTTAGGAVRASSSPLPPDIIQLR